MNLTIIIGSNIIWVLIIIVFSSLIYRLGNTLNDSVVKHPIWFKHTGDILTLVIVLWLILCAGCNFLLLHILYENL